MLEDITCNVSPGAIGTSWGEFNKERNGLPGLRPDGVESAIVGVGTGIGKTGTMLVYTIANLCKKVFVIVQGTQEIRIWQQGLHRASVERHHHRSDVFQKRV